MMRRFSRYIRAYEPYVPNAYKSPAERTKTSTPLNSAYIGTPYTAKLESLGGKSVIKFDAELDYKDFETSDSDFDVETFNLKEWVWSILLFRQNTRTNWYLSLSFWIFVTVAALSVKKKLSILRILLSPVGYFELTTPAYYDFELTRYHQRLKLNVLHSYD
jgi:hypothetical protein